MKNVKQNNYSLFTPLALLHEHVAMQFGQAIHGETGTHVKSIYVLFYDVMNEAVAFQGHESHMGWGRIGVVEGNTHVRSLAFLFQRPNPFRSSESRNMRSMYCYSTYVYWNDRYI